VGTVGELRHGKFAGLIGASPRNVIIEFLVAGRELDHAVSNIAAFLRVNKVTAYAVIDTLVSEGLVIPTRQVGKTQLYKINMSNRSVSTLIQMYDIALKA
jgi:Fic family protein